MDIAEVVAKRSHDAETQVGSILVNNESGSIISTGYNGFVRGAKDTNLPNTRPEKYKFILHSEQNLICNAARHGISMDNCTLVTTMSPCVHCMRLLYNTGVNKVIAKDLYRDFDDILKMPDIKVEVSKEEDGFYHITYKMD
jgi:dCMP deaminase